MSTAPHLEGRGVPGSLYFYISVWIPQRFLDCALLSNTGWPGTCALTSTSSAGSGVIHLFKLFPAFVNTLIQIHHAASPKERFAPKKPHNDKWQTLAVQDNLWYLRNPRVMMEFQESVQFAWCLSLSQDNVTVLLRVTSYCRASCNHLSQSPWVKAFIAVSLFYISLNGGINICVAPRFSS